MTRAVLQVITSRYVLFETIGFQVKIINLKVLVLVVLFLPLTVLSLKINIFIVIIVVIDIEIMTYLRGEYGGQIPRPPMRYFSYKYTYLLWIRYTILENPYKLKKNVHTPLLWDFIKYATESALSTVYLLLYPDIFWNL